MYANNKKFRLKDEILITNDNYVVKFDTGKSYKVNQVARDVLEMCDGNHSVEEIIKDISRRYDASHETIIADIPNFIETAVKLGLLLEVV